MNKFLKSIFYQFYVWACKYNFANSPHLSAMYMLSLLLTLNIWGISQVIKISVRYELKGIENSKIGSLLLVGVITLIIYLLYTRNGKYKLIEKEFIGKSKKEKEVTRYIAIGYIFVSILLAFGAAIYIGLNKKAVI